MDSRETMSDRFSTHGEFPDLPIVFWGNGASNARDIHIGKENQSPEFKKNQPISKIYVFSNSGWSF